MSSPDIDHPDLDAASLHSTAGAITSILDWYATDARDLPWRQPTASAWSILVSEIMLQQTPVNRVLPKWKAWMERWPTPADLAAAPVGEAIRQWDRLGYPRRAQRLHAAAQTIVDEHNGVVPSDEETLLTLPGVGTYTAAAVAAFAFQQRSVVVDTNIRRVEARLFTGNELPAKNLSAAEMALATEIVEQVPDAGDIPTWNVAVMELGALVCTARNPKCDECVVQPQCAWIEAGCPPHDGPRPKGQTYAGTDRQVRGKILAVLRQAQAPVPLAEIAAVWADDTQRERCLHSLLSDGLAVLSDVDHLALPD